MFTHRVFIWEKKEKRNRTQQCTHSCKYNKKTKWQNKMSGKKETEKNNQQHLHTFSCINLNKLSKY